MRIVDVNNKTVELQNKDWPLAEDLFLRWGYCPSHDNIIKVRDIEDIVPELSAWGIPWKYTGE